MTLTSWKAYSCGFCHAGSHVGFFSLEGPVGDGGEGGVWSWKRGSRYFGRL